MDLFQLLFCFHGVRAGGSSGEGTTTPPNHKEVSSDSCLPEMEFLPVGLRDRAAAVVNQWHHFCFTRGAALVSFLLSSNLLILPGSDDQYFRALLERGTNSSFLHGNTSIQISCLLFIGLRLPAMTWASSCAGHERRFIKSTLCMLGESSLDRFCSLLPLSAASSSAPSSSRASVLDEISRHARIFRSTWF